VDLDEGVRALLSKAPTAQTWPPALVAALADRPHVVRAGRRHAVQGVGRPARVGAVHDRPGQAVPVLDERAERAVPGLLLADGPDVGGDTAVAENRMSRWVCSSTMTKM
jgi:hypothetical protein